MSNEPKKQTLLKADEPTLNGDIYPLELLKSIADENRGRVENRRVVGELGLQEERHARLGKVSHVVTDLEVENDELQCSIESLETPEGHTLIKMLDLGQVQPIVRGMGTVKNGVVEDFKLMSVDFVPITDLGTLDIIVRRMAEED